MMLKERWAFPLVITMVRSSLIKKLDKNHNADPQDVEHTHRCCGIGSCHLSFTQLPRGQSLGTRVEVSLMNQ